MKEGNDSGINTPASGSRKPSDGSSSDPNSDPDRAGEDMEEPKGKSYNVKSMSMSSLISNNSGNPNIKGGMITKQDEEGVAGAFYNPAGGGKTTSFVNGRPEEAPELMVVKKLSYFSVFRYASWGDILMMLVGIVGGIASGVAMPLMLVQFGDLIQQMVDVQKTPDYDSSGAAANSSDSGLLSVFDPTDLFAAFESEMTDITVQISILGAFVFVVSYFQITYMTLAGENILYRLRKRSFEAVLRQDIGWFDYQKTGKLVTRLADDMEKIRQGVSDKVALCVQYFATFFAGFVIAFWYGWKMALVMCSIFPPLAIGGLGFAYASGSSTSAEQEEYGEAGAIAEYTFSAIRTVVAFGGETREIAKYNQKLRKARWQDLKKATMSGGFLGWAFGFMFAGYALAFWYGPKQIVADEMTEGEVMIVFFGVLIGAMSIGQAAPLFGLISTVGGSFSFIQAILDRTPPIDSQNDTGKKLSAVSGKISLRNVNFSYPTRPSVQVLKNFCLEIMPGQTIALVGSSGSGKSTIINLLQRFYQGTGEIHLDGEEISQLHLGWLRNQIGLVSQEPILFGCSIRENIKYGQDDVSDAMVERAIVMANAKEFIDRLPKGLDTLVGERGSQLSGGQKQRIAIARALVRDPKTLLLDEATSALDSASEKIVQDALDNARSGRTTIMVAHRLSTVKNVDLIVAMTGGRVVETGTHAELIAKDGLYADLVRAQDLNNSNEQNSVDANSTVQMEKNGRTYVFHGVTVDSKEVAINVDGGQGGKANLEKTLSKDSKAGPKDQEEPLPGIGLILKMNSPEAIYIAIGCLFALIAAGSMPLFALAFAEIIEVFALPDDEMVDEALFWAGMFLLLGVVTGLCYLVEAWALGQSGSRLTERLRSKSFHAMVRQDMSFFDSEANYVGALTTKLAKEASLVQGASGIRIKAALEAVMSMLVGLAIAFIFGWQLALLLLACVIPIGVAGGIQMKFQSGFQLSESKDSKDGCKVVTESISNIRTVQSLGLERRMFKQFHQSLMKAHKQHHVMAHMYGLAQSVSQSLFFFLYAGAFRFAAWLIAGEKIDSADAFRVIFALVFSAMGLGQSTAMLPDLAKAQVAARDLLALFSLQPLIDNLSTSGKTLESSSKGSAPGEVQVEFKNVHFRYPSRPKVQILKGLDLKVRKGQTVALVGPSGCGKSTVMQLVQRFYDPEGGKVLLDGVDIKTLNVRDLRKHLSIVSQEPMLFNASIRENILYSVMTDDGQPIPGKTFDHVIKACKDANVHTFIDSLPQKYETNVGEKGTQLSGGQKQRIAIARALIREPKILLLDEATSALDTESEKMVQRAIDEVRVGRTCIIIAHRLTTIQSADVIYVLDQGQVVQEGNHAQLIADKEGLYYKFCQAQKLRADHESASTSPNA